MSWLKHSCKWLLALLWLPILLLAAVVARFWPKPINIGLGPEPLVNNVYHKQALQLYGYSAETFVSHVYYITQQFDFRGDLAYWGWLRKLGFHHYLLAVRCFFRYQVLYIYFNGGPLGVSKLAPLEAYLYAIAGIQIVVMPYGSDCYVALRNSNLIYRNGYIRDYPQFCKQKYFNQKWQVDYWLKHAKHVIAGCDWVYYLWYWDSLMLAHFSINSAAWQLPTTRELPEKYDKKRPLTILHAPNHTSIKGSKALQTAINELRNEGYAFELVFVQRLSNEQLKERMQSVDIVCDQLVIGWYGIFALEAMAMGKPVICHIAPDLEEFYLANNLLEVNELPVIRANLLTIKDVLRQIYANHYNLAQLSQRGQYYVEKHHSLTTVGAEFAKINQKLIGENYNARTPFANVSWR